MTLTEFLLARIAEDEQIARAATDGVWSWVSDGYYDANAQSEFLTLETSEDVGEYGTVIIGSWSAYSDGDGLEVSMNDRLHVVTWQPARVLAECKAKRRIVEVHQQSSQEVWLDIPDSAWSPEEWSSFRPDYYERDACTCCDDLALMANETREWPCRTLRALAAVYRDHPDFNPEWAI